MKHTNKKGFTIVELVIVIAVIAILAAVLIPTFSNLIKKANISNDTAIAKNLNTAAISAQADDFGKAIEAAKEAGYLVGHLNAKAEKVFFVWEDDTNQFLLYDLKAEKILYSNTKVDGAPDASWYFVVNNVEDKNGVAAAFKNEDGSIKVKVQYLVGEVAALKDVLAAGGEVYIDESLALDNANLLHINSNATINLGSSALNTSGVVKTETLSEPIKIGATSTVTINGGTIAAASEVLNLDERPIKIVLLAQAGSNLTINDTVFDNTAYNAQMKFESTVTLNNVVINATKSGFDTRYDALVTLNNVTINMVDSDFADTFGCWVWSCNSAHDESKNAKVVINSGTYTREAMSSTQAQDCGGIASCGGDVEINGGTFSAADNKYFSFEGNHPVGEIVIKGGTFGDKTFGDADFTVAYLQSLCVNGVVRQNADGSFTITLN